MADPTATEGQAVAAPEGQAAPAPVVDQGQSVPVEQTSASPAKADESFFDPNEVPEALKPAYKQMQAAFTKKTQALAANKQKIDAYDSFSRDPVGTMQQLARQYGFSLTRAEAQQAVNEQKQEWTPKNWDDVLSKAKDAAKQELYGELQPVFQKVQELERSSIEKTLDDSIPEWRQYEDEMTETLRQHPTLVNDPVKLAMIAMPKEHWESKAAQKALKSLKEKAEANKVSGGSQTTREQTINLDRPRSFQEAVEAARTLIAQGKGWGT
jgi:hypothetical protein